MEKLLTFLDEKLRFATKFPNVSQRMMDEALGAAELFCRLNPGTTEKLVVEMWCNTYEPEFNRLIKNQ